MNVEHLIKQIKIRPGMYVGCLKLEPVVHFINGFLYNNKISKYFSEKFFHFSRGVEI